MKLIIKEYLASLKERDELDAILPDLLSQLGLNVYSRPARGTRQDGVDVAAVGSLDGGADRIYLFSIKSGDLTRNDWDGCSLQSLRPSLNEIIDSYIPHRLPAEHIDKDVSICITIGGDVRETVRPLLTGYINQNSKGKICFEEWNGDKLAEYIQNEFLREDLLPKQARSLLRKSLAMLDEPEVSYRHFTALIQNLSEVDAMNEVQQIRAIRQMSICLWILFSWARENGNIESAYLSSEVTLLHAWSIFKKHIGNNKLHGIETAFYSIFLAYRQVCTEFIGTNLIPHVNKLHGVSSAIQGHCNLDINLKLFDLLGRVGINGLWAYWEMQRFPDNSPSLREKLTAEVKNHIEVTKKLVINNPALLLPAKDDQAIDIFIALLLIFCVYFNERSFVTGWLKEIIDRAQFAYEVHGKYPNNLSNYSDLLRHPKFISEDYRKNVTSASILYPSIALWAALTRDAETYKKVSKMQKEQLQHCTFQFWYPDDASEEHFYKNSDVHGAALLDFTIDDSAESFLAQAFGECEHSSNFMNLSAIKENWWPLIIIACRHHRLPVPLHFLEEIYRENLKI